MEGSEKIFVQLMLSLLHRLAELLACQLSSVDSINGHLGYIADREVQRYYTRT